MWCKVSLNISLEEILIIIFFFKMKAIFTLISEFYPLAYQLSIRESYWVYVFLKLFLRIKFNKNSKNCYLFFENYYFYMFFFFIL